MSEVTRILSALGEGDPHAADELLPLVYNELRRLAAAKLAQENPGQTLQATALVHEAYLRLLGPADGDWENRRHFFAAAAEAMRRILIESTRRKRRIKHGGDEIRLPLQDGELITQPPSVDLLALDEALDRLASQDAAKAELVKLRYFAGLTEQQAADVLGISRSTAKRYWAYASAWLFREISKGDDPT